MSQDKTKEETAARSQPQSPPVEQKEWPARVWIVPAQLELEPYEEFGQALASTKRRVMADEPYLSLAESTAREAALRELLKKAEEALEKVEKYEGCFRGCQCGCVSSLNWIAEEALAAIRAGREGAESD